MLIATQSPAYAYADPGSGTLIWQILLAASFGVMFYLRRMIGWFRGLKSDKQQARAPEPQRKSESVERRDF
jgi:hypothetical protein